MQSHVVTQTLTFVGYSDGQVEVVQGDAEQQLEQVDVQTVLQDQTADSILKFTLVRNLCYQGDKSVIDLFEQKFYPVDTLQSVVFCDFSRHPRQPAQGGVTTLLFECRKHPGLLIQLLQKFKIKPEVLNATITAEFNLIGYKYLDPKKEPVTLLQFALCKKNLVLLQELVNQPGINLQGAMEYAVNTLINSIAAERDFEAKYSRMSTNNKYSNNLRDKECKENIDYLRKVILLLQDALIKRGIPLSENERGLVDIFNEEFSDQVAYITQPGFLTADLDFLAGMRRNPPQKPDEVRARLFKAVGAGHVASYCYQLREFKIENFAGIVPFADLLDTALSDSQRVRVEERLFRHPCLQQPDSAQREYAAIGHAGNTLEVLMKHYAKAQSEKDLSRFRTRISNLLHLGIPPEDRHQRCITQLMRQLSWSTAHTETEKRSFDQMLQPFTEKYGCRPRTCAWVTQKATNAKRFIFNLPANFFGKKVVMPVAPAEQKQSGPSLSLVPREKKD